MSVGYRAVLFDLDGTLLDTLEDLGRAVNKGLLSMGFPQHQVEEYKNYVGEGREILAALSLPENRRDAETVGRLVTCMDEEYSRNWADHTLPYPGVPELLDTLTAKGVKMAILSNKPHHFTALIVSRLLCSWSFEAVVGALPSVPKKPDCAAASSIARQAGFEPSEFLYLGDTGIDMKTAVAAGMYPVGALWGFRAANELRECGAKTLIERPGDLLDLL